MTNLFDRNLNRVSNLEKTVDPRPQGRTQAMLESAVEASHYGPVAVVAAGRRQQRELFLRLKRMGLRATGDEVLRNGNSLVYILTPCRISRCSREEWTMRGRPSVKVFVDHEVIA